MRSSLRSIKPHSKCIEDPAPAGVAREDFAFFEAYFSNYMEGTAFEVEEAESIIFEGKIIENRDEDSHDILGTFQAATTAPWRDRPPQNAALVLTEGPSSVPDPYVPDPTKFRWLRIGVPGHIGEQGTQVDPNAVARLKLPDDFAARLNGLLTPGATLFVTNEALYPTTTGPMVQVVDADPPAHNLPAHSGGAGVDRSRIK